MKTKLHQITNTTANKTYTYLSIVISKKTMQALKPTHVIINLQQWLFPLKLKTRYDGRGYAILPCEIANFFKLQKNQEIEIKLKFGECEKWVKQ